METAKQIVNRISYFEAGDILVKAFPKGSKAWTLTVNHDNTGVYASVIILGMINGELMNLSACVARLMENNYDDNNRGVRVKGGGLDKAHHTVDWLSRTLHRDGNHIIQVGL